MSKLMGSFMHLHIMAEGKEVIVIVSPNGEAAHFQMGSEVDLTSNGNVMQVLSKEDKTLSSNEKLD